MSDAEENAKLRQDLWNHAELIAQLSARIGYLEMMLVSRYGFDAAEIEAFRLSAISRIDQELEKERRKNRGSKS